MCIYEITMIDYKLVTLETKFSFTLSVAVLFFKSDLAPNHCVSNWRGPTFVNAFAWALLAESLGYFEIILNALLIKVAVFSSPNLIFIQNLSFGWKRRLLSRLNFSSYQIVDWKKLRFIINVSSMTSMLDISSSDSLSLLDIVV